MPGPKTKPKPREKSGPEPLGADAFAAVVGGLVRSARAKRGITRRALAEQSGASERYLAQIESGQGNPSVVILKGIADALDVPVTELLPRTGGRSASLNRTLGYRRSQPGPFAVTSAPSQWPRQASRRPAPYCCRNA